MSTPPPRDPKIPLLLSLQEAADRLGISKQAAHKRALRGQLPGAQVGTTWVFRAAVVDSAAPTALPPGDIHFDGEHLSIGGQVLAPGRYAVGDSGAVLTVEPPIEDDDLP